MNWKSMSSFLFILLVIHGVCNAESTLTSFKVDMAPIIDGKGQDPVWARAQELVTHDKIADLDITLKSIYTDTELFFLVRFNDPNESRLHKPWIWNKEMEMYEMGPQREDCFVFKWAMSNDIEDLSLLSDKPYVADVWFWKANRTDPVEYADDKIQRLDNYQTPKSMKLVSHTGNPMYLQRRGDMGHAAYKSHIRVEHTQDMLNQFKNKTPSGSRANIKAKGQWLNNQWCIEFSRALNTGEIDDLQFNLSKKYLFGISRYEIAGRKPDPKLTQPLYGSGDISEKLELIFNP